ncbi:hypothetical protein RDI58_022106 [Solanum bulbocastanum]|uniref:Uncharacterized protein n=1 Tax=Solanum bulbocastanum TaxID=147425 RepID=A0AAN8Y5H3_SOLBU
MEVDPLDVEMEFHMENQHEHENINTIKASDEWTTWRDELIEMASSTTATSNTSKKRARKSAPSSRRVWTPKEELTLVDELKELCVNETFRHEYLMELEHYMNARHPNCGLESLPHVDSKIRAWTKSYATISLLKSRSGLGFQYSDGSILVDDPKAWNNLIKLLHVLILYFLRLIQIPNDASGTREDQAAQEEPNVSTGATQSPFTTQDKPNESTRAAQNSFTTQKGLIEVMKQFTESHDKRMASLIDKLGERDLSEIRDKIFSIIGSPAFEIYNSDERVKAVMEITQDIERMDFS